MEHFRFEGQGHPLAYKSRRGGGGGERRVRPNPAAHGKRLGEELGDAVGETPSEAILAIDYYDGTRGRLIAFELDYAYAGADPTIDEFGGGKYGIELVRVDRLEARRRRVLLYVPFTATTFLIDQLRSFTKSGGAKDKHWASVESIERVAAKSLYHDDPDYYPADESTVLWFELWIVRERANQLESLCARYGFDLQPKALLFHNRRVVLVRLSPKQLVESHLINLVADIAKPVLSVTQLHGMPGAAQSRLLGTVRQRLLRPNRRVRAALLDTGVTTGHLLLNGVVAHEDIYDLHGGPGADDAGHGTGIASLVLYGGDLEHQIGSEEPTEPVAQLESVKVMSQLAERETALPVLLGERTARACYLLPAIGTEDPRVFVSTISDVRKSTSGAPDSYSAALDLLAFGDSPIPEAIDLHGPKLVLQSAGNSEVGKPHTHLESPAQAWNAVTVGAFTERLKVLRQSANYVAKQGDRSPSSSHGLGYDAKRSLKPNILMEGGNAERTALGDIEQQPDCMLLAASNAFPKQHFALFNGTSAAAALAGHLVAKIWAKYPSLTPQSVRALLINSAMWTDAMLASLNEGMGVPAHTRLVQRYGMGVPRPQLALDSEQNFVTLIYEEALQPFVPGKDHKKQDFKQYQTIDLK